MSTPPVAARPANRLAREKSPYLLQHAHNPVDWYPWGDEAFERARAEDRPILLSIGYSTCHWCHVMERESFENDAVAELLNRWFVCVKVDREERPDVDRIYMTAMQAMGQGGGWPLNVFLTPELVPFWGGTYFPPSATSGRPGLQELLPRLHEAWSQQREQIQEQGGRVMQLLESLGRPEREAARYDDLARECFEFLERQYDPEHGGFGTAPKFPSPVNLAFLMRWWARAPHERGDALTMAVRQLDAMRAGGLHDHLGGGFHRYSTDREWLVPHFEKMLYDQALIADAYVEGFLATGDARYAGTVRGVFDYVARDLTSPQGAFFSAEDADSEGEEGRFYVWTPAQLEAVLGESDARLFAQHYGVTPQGNFEHGASILNRTRSAESDDVKARLERSRALLLVARATRPRPHLDDKVLTAWNGLMIAALAKGARALGDPALATLAVRAAEFVWTHSRQADGSLHRRWRDGEAGAAGQLDDHAYFARGCLELYAATHEPLWLERALALTETMIERFWDDDEGACFESPAGDASVRVRMKDGFDGAEMAGNSIAAEVLVRLGELLDRADLREKANATFAYYARRLAGNAWAMPRMLCAMDRAAGPSRQVVIAGGRDADDTRALLAVFERRLRPADEIVLVDGASREALSSLAPFTATLQPMDGHAAAYVCVDYACRLPVANADAFAAQLDSPQMEIR